jgi:hypothetical protein
MAAINRDPPPGAEALPLLCRPAFWTSILSVSFSFSWFGDACHHLLWAVL